MSDNATWATTILRRGRNANDEQERQRPGRQTPASARPTPPMKRAAAVQPRPNDQMTPESPQRQRAAGNQDRSRNSARCPARHRSDRCRINPPGVRGSVISARRKAKALPRLLIDGVSSQFSKSTGKLTEARIDPDRRARRYWKGVNVRM